MDIRHIAKYQIKETLKQNKLKVALLSHDMCTYKNEDLFSPIVEKIKPGDMPRLFLKIKLDKQNISKYSIT